MATSNDFWNCGRPLHSVGRFEHCRQALSDPRLTSDPFGVGVTNRPTHNLLMMSGPEHVALRNLINPFFAPAAVARLAGELRATRDVHLHRLLAAGSGDLVADFVEPLVLEAALRTVGLIERTDEVAPPLRSMLGMLEPQESDAVEVEQAQTAALQIAALVYRQGRSGQAEGLCRRLREAHTDAALSRADATFALPVILHGGYENPLNYLGTLVAIACEDAAGFATSARRWHAGFIEETLRLHPPARGVARWATTDIPALGAAAGDAIWLDIEASNRDAAIFGSGQPNYAKPRRHLTFGHGPHRCPGSRLARLLAELVIDGVLALPEEVLSQAAIQRRVGTVSRGIAVAEVSGL